MRARDLDLKELLQFDHEGGILRFAGERVLLFDAVALGLLRRELIDTLGLTGARSVLTRFGYAHGREPAIGAALGPRGRTEAARRFGLA